MKFLKRMLNRLMSCSDTSAEPIPDQLVDAFKEVGLNPCVEGDRLAVMLFKDDSFGERLYIVNKFHSIYVCQRYVRENGGQWGVQFAKDYETVEELVEFFLARKEGYSEIPLESIPNDFV